VLRAAATNWSCRPGLSQSIAMLYYAVIFFLVALVTALFGFGGAAVGVVGIAKILFAVFVLLAFGSLITGLLRRS
jgi:uncharacterized membrane protein YtjA (UPF0391 family)